MTSAMDGITHKYLPASTGCWATFNDVLAKEFSDPAYWKTHRLTVDAYCSLHASGTDRRQVQSVVIYLVALHLNFEKHCSDERIAESMGALIRKHKHQFPVLIKPSFADTENVTSLLAAMPQNIINLL